MVSLCIFRAPFIDTISEVRLYENKHFLKKLQNNKSDFVFLVPKVFRLSNRVACFQAALPEFEKRNTIVISASCDTNEVHCLVEHCKKNGGIEGYTPILADTNRNLKHLRYS
jgi:peroxiredoxin (alkyl hydroperoxide reductase subunit C)